MIAEINIKKNQHKLQDTTVANGGIQKIIFLAAISLLKLYMHSIVIIIAIKTDFGFIDKGTSDYKNILG